MGKRKILIMIVVVLIFIIIVSVFTLFFIRENSIKKDDMIKIDKNIRMYSFDNSFVTNLKDSKRILKATIKLELSNSKIEEIVIARNPEIRNEINLILRGKNEEALKGSEGQAMLQKEILDTLRKLLKTESLLNVYFDEFIIQ